MATNVVIDRDAINKLASDSADPAEIRRQRKAILLLIEKAPTVQEYNKSKRKKAPKVQGIDASVHKID